MKFGLIRGSQASDSLWQEAIGLHARCTCVGDPLLHPDLARILAGVRSDTHLALAHQGDELVGFWGLQLRSGGWARPLAGPFSDWHAPLIAAGVDLDPLDLLKRAGVAGMTVHGYSPRPGEPCRAGRRTGAHLSVVKGNQEDWWEVQRAAYPKHFKKMRRIRRNLERDFAEVVIDTDDRSDAAFEAVLRLKHEQFARTGRHDVLSNDWAKAMIAALRASERPHLHLRNITLHVDGRFAAGEIVICSQTVVHGWLTAYEQDFAAYSPGFIITESIIRDMLARGQNVYDAGCDAEHYKKYYTNVMAPLDHGVLRAASSLADPTRFLGACYRTTESLMPGRAGELMSKVRRRSDQILISETSTVARLKGFQRALSRTTD